MWRQKEESSGGWKENASRQQAETVGRPFNLDKICRLLFIWSSRLARLPILVPRYQSAII
jgi:hypothetical protein